MWVKIEDLEKPQMFKSVFSINHPIYLGYLILTHFPIFSDLFFRASHPVVLVLNVWIPGAAAEGESRGGGEGARLAC